MKIRSGIGTWGLVVALGALSAWGTPPARANLIVNYISDANFSVQITHMPDLDQRRAAASGIVGLPGNGSMYCVPTATLNTILYAANHGFPQVMPGPGNWQSQTLYNTGGNNLAALGTLMGTDAVNGTGGNGWYNGAWVWMLPYNKFVVTNYYASGFYSPTFLTVSKKAMLGELVSLAYGRYELRQVNGQVAIVGSRTGGHAVTFSRGLASGANKSLYVRDPADDSQDLYSQSQFGDKTFSILDFVVSGPGYARIMSAINYPQNDGLIRFIDGVVTIRPKAGYSFTNNDGFKIKLHQPIKLLGAATPDELEFHSPTGTPFIAAALLPDFDGFAAIVQGGGTTPNSIHLIDMLSGQSRLLTTLPGASALNFGRNRAMFALAGAQLHEFDLARSTPLVASTTPPYTPTAMTFDDENDELVVLSVPGRRLLRYPGGVGGTARVLLLPANVALAGDGSVIVNPVDGRTWFCSQGSHSLFEAYVPPPGGLAVNEIALPAVQFPTALEFDDGGNLFVTCAAGLLEFQKATGGGWQRVLNSDFAGLPVGQDFHLTRSRTNFDPATMSGPGYYNLPPSEVVQGQFVSDNPGDLNCDGLVDFGDINPFVLALTDPAGYARAFRSCNILNGDINGDGLTNFGDINPFVRLLTGP